MHYKDVLKLNINHCDDVGACRREYAMAHMSPLVYDRSSYVLEPAFRAPWNCNNESLACVEEIGYKTGSGNVMSLLVHVFELDRMDVPLLTEYEHVSLCGSCKGSNGGCPGFAPRFDMIKRSTDTMYIVTVTFDMAWSLKYATPNGLHYGYVLQQLAYADRLTDRYVRRMLMYLREHSIGHVIGLGNCPGCHTKDCTVRKGGRCSHPEKRIYSMEATGIDCDELHAMLYGEYLPWYYKGTNTMPQYMTRYCGVISDKPSSEVISHISNFIVCDKSYVPIESVIDVSQEYNVVLVEIPSGPHKGGQQHVYEQQV